jgi:hypothetical protein
LLMRYVSGDKWIHSIGSVWPSIQLRQRMESLRHRHA